MGTEADRVSDAEDELAVKVAFRGFLGSVEIGGQCMSSDYTLHKEHKTVISCRY